MKLAIFDFDGTLYKKETFPLLMDFLKHHPSFGKKYKRFYASILLPYISYKLGIYSERKMKANLMHKYLQIFKGCSEDIINKYFIEIAHTMKIDLNEDMIARLHEHSQNNFYIMVVSGAYTPLLQATLTHLPINTFIGTEIPLENKIFAPYRQIDHVQAERKKELIKMNFPHQTIDWKNSYAYGDSYADLPVLKLVGNPIAVCPDEKLKDIANTNNWSIIN